MGAVILSSRVNRTLASATVLLTFSYTFLQLYGAKTRALEVPFPSSLKGANEMR
nr:hypothetical protein [Bartonella bovis]